MLAGIYLDQKFLRSSLKGADVLLVNQHGCREELNLNSRLQIPSDLTPGPENRHISVPLFQHVDKLLKLF